QRNLAFNCFKKNKKKAANFEEDSHFNGVVDE
ncbi:MAG: hypothetical protein RIQ89_2371, partial [Bacteroidota bacterium]